jgi:hypothetical protein
MKDLVESFGALGLEQCRQQKEQKENTGSLGGPGPVGSPVRGMGGK